MNISLEGHLFSREMSFILYFLKEISTDLPSQDSWLLLTLKDFSVLFLNYSGVLILSLLRIHKVCAHIPAKTLYIQNTCTNSDLDYF